MIILKRTSFFIFFILFFGQSLIAQKPELNAIDSLIEKTFKENNKCKKIIKGTRRTGTGYFYLNKTGKLLWVQSRQQFKTGRREDSSLVYFHYFLNDSLVKTVYFRSVYKNGEYHKGYSYLYYNKDSVVERTEVADAPLPALDLLLKEAYYYLKHSYEIDKGHRYRRSSQ